ncbi:hypothetical protein BC834DRAFT_865598 [Gloeopeniophorella convolvens]|nr:hypothetical protein BC834DRAFT_865598 [Gloeopeniophorella convolvens]
MSTSVVSSYRAILRELRKASISPRSSRSNTTASTFRAILESSTSRDLDTHAQNAITFLRSQHTYKILLDRYNPLFDLTAEERIEATARRVGLNMPITPQEDKSE